MKDFDLPDVGIERISGNPDDALVLRSRRTLHTLSSATVGGGFCTARIILNRHVHKDYATRDPHADMITFARQHGVQEQFVGLMTAVFLDNAKASTCTDGGLRVATVATVGLGNRIAAGLTEPIPLSPGTINLIVLVDAHLTPAAMVNAAMTLTEAKSQVLSSCGLRTEEGYAATGTSTDALVVACTGRGPALPYAGLIALGGTLGFYELGRLAEGLVAPLPAPLRWTVEATLLKTTFSIHRLARAAGDIQAALDRDDLPEARRLTSWHLVSRDTSALTRSEVAAAAIRSVAESTSDGIMAPLVS